MTEFGLIISSVLGSGLLFGALGWLFKSIITHYLSKDIDKFKATLEFEAQKELVRIQTSLAMEAFEHQIRFTRLHEKRAEIISQIYGAIVDLHFSVDKFVRLLPSSSPEENDSNLHAIWNAADLLKSLFEKDRIFFSKELCEKIAELNEIMSKPVGEIVIHLEISKTQNWEILGKRWAEALDVLEQKVPVLRSELESSFRQLLGVLSASSKQ